MHSPRFPVLAAVAVMFPLAFGGPASVRAQDAAFTTLVSFQTAAQMNASSLVAATDGNLYGTTASTLFELTPDGTLITLHNFTGYDDGGEPDSLIQASDGSFYGTTNEGGTGFVGTVFRFTPADGLAILHDFTGHDGEFPQDLIQASDGNFYGITEYSSSENSTFFRVTPDGTFTMLHSFTSDEGQFLDGHLIQGSDGNFYGPSHYSRSIYRITPDGVVSTFYTLPNTSADLGVIQATDGNFYGVTGTGGNNGTGTIFKINASGGFTLLHSFGASNSSGYNADGIGPSTGLFQASDGDFYGATQGGGPAGDGTLYRIQSNGAFTTLHAFSGPDGAQPGGALVEDVSGQLYGTTHAGGAGGEGTVFRLNIAGILQFSPAAYSVPEEAGGVTLQISRASYGAGAVTVRYATADGTARAGHDYAATSGTLSWAAGDVSPKSIFVPLYNPGVEYGGGARAFTVVLSAPTGGAALDAAPAATVVLLGETVPPVVTGAMTAAADVGAAFSYQITATNQPTSYNVLGLPNGLTFDPATGLIGGAPAAAGTFKLTLVAINRGGKGQASLTLTVTLRAPVITSAAQAIGDLGVPLRYQIVASGNPARYAVLGLTPGLAVDAATGLISGTPQEGAGTHHLTLEASNSMGKATAPLTLTLEKVPPRITSATAATGVMNKPFQYQVTATNDPTTFRAAGLPPGIGIDRTTGLITGGTTRGGTYTVTLSATSAGGTGTATLTLTILSPPVITSATTASDTVNNDSFFYLITATNNPTSYYAANLPPGIGLNRTTGLISGVTRAPGTYTVTLYATGAGGTGKATLTLTVTQ